MSKRNNQLLDLAAKAIKKFADSNPGNKRTHRPIHPSSEWRTIVRSATEMLGEPQRASTNPTLNNGSAPGPRTRGQTTGDPRAGERELIARYDYLVRTAEPRELKEIHRSTFETLTPGQRDAIAARMREELPEHERPRSSSPEHLAWTATRAERMRPGRMRGLLARSGNVSGLAGGLLIALAGTIDLAGLADSVGGDSRQRRAKRRVNWANKRGRWLRVWKILEVFH